MSLMVHFCIMGMTNKQKKEWAHLVYTKEGLNQKETAAKVGVTAKTLNIWVGDGKWDELKASFTVSKEQQLKRIYAQINELNSAIEKKKPGEKYADSKEADTLTKLASSARSLETETSIAEIINTFIDFQNWLRGMDFEKAREFAKYQDDFVKSKLK
jgi:hypothetical protein